MVYITCWLTCRVLLSQCSYLTLDQWLRHGVTHTMVTGNADGSALIVNEDITPQTKLIRQLLDCLVQIDS